MFAVNEIHPAVLALIAGLFTWGCTGLGAAVIFFFTRLNRRLSGAMLGFSAGVMVAASFWSLLEPAITLCAPLGTWSFLPVLIGFLSGGALIILLDRAVIGLSPVFSRSDHQPFPGSSSMWLTVLAIILHNIPEGLAIGVAFGATAAGDATAMASSVALAVGIGIQNIPEGAAVSIPFRISGRSKTKSFLCGLFSAVVEPVFSVVGAFLVSSVSAALPYILSLTAGAMIFVVFKELIPEAQQGGGYLSVISAMLGFGIMMALDVALG